MVSNGIIFNDLERPLSHKRLNTWPYANRKPQPSFRMDRMVPVSMTLSDFDLFQGHGGTINALDVAGLLRVQLISDLFMIGSSCFVRALYTYLIVQNKIRIIH